YSWAIVRSPLTLEISVASKRSFQRTAAMPSRSGKRTSVGSKAMASNRKRTERPSHRGMRTLPGVRMAARLDIPCSALAVDGLAGDAEAPRGLLPVAADLLQDGQGVALLHFLQCLVAADHILGRLPAQFLREGTEDQRPLYHVAQLAHVAGPVIARDGRPDGVVNRHRWHAQLLGELPHEQRREVQHIVFAVLQRRKVDP